MAGMLQIITYLLCVYLIFKGVEIFQIALVSTTEKWAFKVAGVLIGVGMIVASVVAAYVFVNWINQQAQGMQQGMQGIPGMPK